LLKIADFGFAKMKESDEEDELF
jgi:serine/threonine-protein kinase ULK2